MDGLSLATSLLGNFSTMMSSRTFSFLKFISSLVLMGGAFCCWILLCVWAIGYLNGDSNNLSILNDSATVAMSATGDSTPQVRISNKLRYTAMGWQTPSHWAPLQTQGSQLSFSRLNPIVFAFLILFASLLAILLYTPDEEIANLLKSSNLKHKEVVAIKLNKLRK